MYHYVMSGSVRARKDEKLGRFTEENRDVNTFEAGSLCDDQILQQKFQKADHKGHQNQETTVVVVHDDLVMQRGTRNWSWAIVVRSKPSMHAKMRKADIHVEAVHIGDNCTVLVNVHHHLGNVGGGETYVSHGQVAEEEVHGALQVRV